MRKSYGSNFSTPLSPPLGLSKMAAFFKRKEPCFVISSNDYDKFGTNCYCFGCTESIARFYLDENSRSSSRCKGQAKRCENSDFVL